ncbi:MAG TPA: hypothetical protein PLP57_08265 [Candidatus Saccharicenans sp.]|nr:hypothetical protein [Candidatus Saccharicenans sp.]HRD02617.1 hypothetical protein [Candidatus Saccharicenans sp.]
MASPFGWQLEKRRPVIITRAINFKKINLDICLALIFILLDRFLNLDLLFQPDWPYDSRRNCHWHSIKILYI